VPLTRGLRTSVTRLRREASFVFDGTVEREASSSVSILAAGPGTVVVRVGHVFHATGDLHDQGGQQVTVVLSDPSLVLLGGARRLFFTEPFIYGETVGVVAIDTTDVPNDREALEGLFREVSAAMDDERLREHLAEADAVVLGAVVERHAVYDPSPLSEHRPDWWVAVIAVAESLKGDLGGELVVRYPNSTDVRWYLTPKPEVGQEAIFVLHRDGLRFGDAELAILHDVDLIALAPDELERHRRLL
jgi:hypothetical protein